MLNVTEVSKRLHDAGIDTKGVFEATDVTDASIELTKGRYEVQIGDGYIALNRISEDADEFEQILLLSDSVVAVDKIIEAVRGEYGSKNKT